MFVCRPTKISSVKINAVVSVLFYSGFIVTTLSLSAIVLGVDLREALWNSPVPETAVTVENHR